jgi:hypothetical protein
LIPTGADGPWPSRRPEQALALIDVTTADAPPAGEER